MIFWLSAVIFTLFIALICFFPLLRQMKAYSQVEREQFNKAFYFDRLKELEQDAEKGLLDDQQQLQVELQQTLLEDIPVEQKQPFFQRRLGKVWFISGFLTLLSLALVAYLPVGAWFSQQMLEKTHDKLPHFFERIAQEQENPLTDSELQQFSIALRLELQKNPNDAKNWWLMGQIAMSEDKGQLALDSYNKAYELDKNNMTYKVSLARILMFSQEQNDNARGRELLKEVLRQDHTNTEALSLFAFDNYQQRDYKMAIMSWGMMLKFLPENDERIPLIERSIANARHDLEMQEKDKKQQVTPQQADK